MDEFKLKEEGKILMCFHIFHSNCIDDWLKEKSTCPLCKMDQRQIVLDQINTDNYNENDLENENENDLENAE